jgi:hypothetical protein
MMLTEGCLSRREGGVLVFLYGVYLAFQFDSIRSMIS